MHRLSLLLTAALFAQDPFLVKPYVQLGDAPELSQQERLALLWHTSDTDFDFAVRVKNSGQWSEPAKAASRRVAVRTIDPFRVWSAPLENLKPGEEFDYQVLNSGAPVFEARARARKSARQPYRFVVFGDCGAGTAEQVAIARQAYAAQSDFVLITGDIVYSRGRVSEYAERYFPVYNSDETPLLRSTLFIGAPGNHDIATTDLTANPDAQAYFYYWSQPLNGPPTSVPALKGDAADLDSFRSSAGVNFPRMASFSFDYGNAHWTVLDSNPSADWREPAMLDWLVKDLKKGSRATWRFVAFHHPGLQSSHAHFPEQHMRHLSPLFEEHNVDVVFSGHVHNYQRSYPLRFRPAADGKWGGPVKGEVTLDKRFDGVKVTRSNGVIYIITGGGGARLYDPPQQDQPGSWQPFTLKFVSKVHSLSRVDVDGRVLTLRQIDANGNEVDRFTLTK